MNEPTLTLTDGNITDRQDVTTDDGFLVTVSVTSRQPDGSWGRLRTDGFAARYVGDGRYYYDASHGATVDEALGKARKAMARRTAQRAEDRAISEAYAGAAASVAGMATLSLPSIGTAPIPDTLTPGQHVWMWAHNRARVGIVGTVSKTGARARVIYVTPTDGVVHHTTYRRTDLQVAS